MEQFYAQHALGPARAVPARPVLWRLFPRCVRTSLGEVCLAAEVTLGVAPSQCTVSACKGGRPLPARLEFLSDRAAAGGEADDQSIRRGRAATGMASPDTRSRAARNVLSALRPQRADSELVLIWLQPGAAPGLVLIELHAFAPGVPAAAATAAAHGPPDSALGAAAPANRRHAGLAQSSPVGLGALALGPGLSRNLEVHAISGPGQLQALLAGGIGLDASNPAAAAAGLLGGSACRSSGALSVVVVPDTGMEAEVCALLAQQYQQTPLPVSDDDAPSPTAAAALGASGSLTRVPPPPPSLHSWAGIDGPDVASAANSGSESGRTVGVAAAAALGLERNEGSGSDDAPQRRLQVPPAEGPGPGGSGGYVGPGGPASCALGVEVEGDEDREDARARERFLWDLGAWLERCTHAANSISHAPSEVSGLEAAAAGGQAAVPARSALAEAEAAAEAQLQALSFSGRQPPPPPTATATVPTGSGGGMQLPPRTLAGLHDPPPGSASAAAMAPQGPLTPVNPAGGEGARPDFAAGREVPRLPRGALELLGFACSRGWPSTSTHLVLGLMDLGHSMSKINSAVQAAYGWSALHLAAASGSAELVAMTGLWRSYSAYAASATVREEWRAMMATPGPGGLTPLHLAAVLPSPATAALDLLTALPAETLAAWFGAAARDGCTPAHYALRAGNSHLNDHALLGLATGAAGLDLDLAGPSFGPGEGPDDGAAAGGLREVLPYAPEALGTGYPSFTASESADTDDRAGSSSGGGSGSGAGGNGNGTGGAASPGLGTWRSPAGSAGASLEALPLAEGSGSGLQVPGPSAFVPSPGGARSLTEARRAAAERYAAAAAAAASAAALGAAGPPSPWLSSPHFHRLSCGSATSEPPASGEGGGGAWFQDSHGSRLSRVLGQHVAGMYPQPPTANRSNGGGGGTAFWGSQPLPDSSGSEESNHGPGAARAESPWAPEPWLAQRGSWPDPTQLVAGLLDRVSPVTSAHGLSSSPVPGPRASPQRLTAAGSPLPQPSQARGTVGIPGAGALLPEARPLPPGLLLSPQEQLASVRQQIAIIQQHERQHRPFRIPGPGGPTRTYVPPTMLHPTSPARPGHVAPAPTSSAAAAAAAGLPPHPPTRRPDEAGVRSGPSRRMLDALVHPAVQQAVQAEVEASMGLIQERLQAQIALMQSGANGGNGTGSGDGGRWPGSGPGPGPAAGPALGPPGPAFAVPLRLHHSVQPQPAAPAELVVAASGGAGHGEAQAAASGRGAAVLTQHARAAAPCGEIEPTTDAEADSERVDLDLAPGSCLTAAVPDMALEQLRSTAADRSRMTAVAALSLGAACVALAAQWLWRQAPASPSSPASPPPLPALCWTALAAALGLLALLSWQNGWGRADADAGDAPPTIHQVCSRPADAAPPCPARQPLQPAPTAPITASVQGSTLVPVLQALPVRGPAAAPDSGLPDRLPDSGRPDGLPDVVSASALDEVPTLWPGALSSLDGMWVSAAAARGASGSRSEGGVVSVGGHLLAAVGPANAALGSGFGLALEPDVDLQDSDDQMRRRTTVANGGISSMRRIG
ncbi:hypothetical protein HYH03_006577 [Edaphochlamys debaryana]|uniref:Uncharacterized protein n=1 Tax=Edaphochlamys debaryana TaxID=47281 RepID=A0A835YAG2_9CHLO|nr:hypothetical protein HYH03_006577 [Edaphochlamys debaryana]|eukprot:KAG2495305.1 hypothetical protein HYH03_006577 [Edaphochlamys debaryana]